MTESTDYSDSWKQRHANACDRVFQEPLMQEVMAEYALNMGFEQKGLAWYGLSKVAMYAAQVARAHALGFDPELLRTTPSEANAALLQHAQFLADAGVPTVVLDTNLLGIVDEDDEAQS